MNTPLLANDYNLVETEIDLKEDENEKGFFLIFFYKSDEIFLFSFNYVIIKKTNKSNSNGVYKYY